MVTQLQDLRRVWKQLLRANESKIQVRNFCLRHFCFINTSTIKTSFYLSAILCFVCLVGTYRVAAQPDNMLAYFEECLPYLDAGGDYNLRQDGVQIYFSEHFDLDAFEKTYQQTAEYSWDTVVYHYVRSLYFVSQPDLEEARQACYLAGLAFVSAAGPDRSVMSRLGLTLERINHLREFIDFDEYRSDKSFGFDGGKEIKGYAGYADIGQIPSFPWPPPQASTDYVLPRSVLQGIDTLGAIEVRLTHALDACGYAERSYFGVPGGFALVTRMEQFNDDGSCIKGSDRWNISLKPSSFDLADYLRALFWGRSGKYRIIVFIVTDQVVAESGHGAASGTARQWLRTGAKYLPPALAAKPFSRDHRCTALIYEFELKETLVNPILLNPASQPGLIHIQKSGILNNIK